MKEALQHASDPTSGKDYYPTPRKARSYYDFWKEWYNQDNEEGAPLKEPVIKLLGSGSDHAPFAFMAGVPAVNLRFKVRPILILQKADTAAIELSSLSCTTIYRVGKRENDLFLA